MRIPVILLVATLAALPADLAAQQRDTTSRRILGDARQPLGATTRVAPATPHSDVGLQVPELSADSIGLEVGNLGAHLALDAEVASLVMLNAGVDVFIERVSLRIEGVLAEAYLYVDLDNVALIV